MSSLILVVTRDQALTKSLAKSLAHAKEDALTVVYVGRLADATARIMEINDVRAVILDWDLPDTNGFEALLVLMSAAPHIPVLVLGDDPSFLQHMNLVEHGAQDYLQKRRLDA